MQVYWVWLSMLAGISARQKLELLDCFSSPKELYLRAEEVPEAYAQALSNTDLTQARAIVKECEAKEIGILGITDSGYPSRLRDISDPPLVLYYKGVLPDFEEQPAIAVVGTRRATPYGLKISRRMSREMAACGALVVSGGAKGVDSVSHEGALRAGGQTVAVLGCGVDIVYPRGNRKLFEQIVKNGCLISEYLPGTGPKPWQFPERNRIISGISNAVLVVEAPEKSGALITATDAMEQGRNVFAVPGNIDSESCRGSNALLQTGASAALSGWDVVGEYEALYPETVRRQQPEIADEPPAYAVEVAQETTFPRLHDDKKDIDNPASRPYSVLNDGHALLSDEEQRLMACLDSAPRPVDEVIAQADIPAARVLSLLTKLALKGLVTNHPGRMVSANKQ